MSDQEGPAAAAGVVAAIVVKKKTGRQPKPVLADEEHEPVVWFGRKQKINSRSHVLVNDGSGETDVLSLAIHSGISTDEDLSELMTSEVVLKSLEAATKTAARHSSKITPTTDGTIITRYYAAGTSDKSPDPRIAYHPSPPTEPSRWAVRGFLTATICSLLDDSQRVRAIGVRGEQTAPESIGGSTMVTFRGQRRELNSIPMSEIEVAEREVLTSSSLSLARDLLCIRRMLHTNSEKGLVNMCGKVRDAEGTVRAEKIIRQAEISEKDKELAMKALEVAAVKAERDRIVECLRVRNSLRAEESIARLAYVMTYYEGLVGIASFKRARHVTVVAAAAPVIVTAPALPVDEEVSALRLELEDAKLEIARLKDDARGKAVPKPKAHRKTKDPDLYLATETDIKNSVRSHMSLYGRGREGSVMGTPMSSVGSTVAMRARKRAGVPEFSPGGCITTIVELRAMEEQGIEAARKLKALSRSREQDLCNAESASEQLAEVVEALSSILTRVTLTIEDVALRRTAILNHMRSLAMHSRSITSIIRERPYLLSLARRMNHERRPVVTLGPMRALINVSALNLKTLREIEGITLESIGGAFEVMSLEEAAATQDDAWATGPEAVVMIPVASSGNLSHAAAAVPRSPTGVLTRATLHRHTQAMDVKPHRGDGNTSDAEEST